MDFIQEYYLSNVGLCDKLIEWFNENRLNHDDGALFSSDGFRSVDKKRKSSKDFSFSLQDVITNNLYNGADLMKEYASELEVFLKDYIKCFGYANNVGPFAVKEGINIQHYKPNDGYKIFHFERCNEFTTYRHLFFITYLNTVEDGGGTEFFYQDRVCKSAKGKTIISPSDWTHAHRGVISPTEEKYIMTGWLSILGRGDVLIPTSV
jgi:prolyl 4-hydroxylase